MVEDERLREALLELQVLREREASSLRDSNALLGVLEHVTNARTSQDAIKVLLSQVGKYLSAQNVAVAEFAVDGFFISQSLGDSLQAGTALPFLKKGGKARNLVNLAPLKSGFPAGTLGDYLSMVSIPIALGPDQIGFVLAFHPNKAAFSNQQMKTATRMCALAEQSLLSHSLQERNRLLAAVIDGSSAGFAISDARQSHNPLVFVNRAFETLTGYNADEVLGENCRMLTAEAPASLERTRLRETVAKQTSGQFLLRNKRKDGTEFWNSLTLFPVMGPDGTVEQLVATQTDATDSVEAQRKQAEAQARMNDALSHTDDAFLLLSEDFRVRFVNPAMVETFPSPNLCWAQGTLFEDNWADYFASLPTSLRPAEATFEHPDLTALLERDTPLEFRLPSGRIALCRARRTSDGGMVISNTDITALKTAERMLRQRVAAIENAPDGMAITDTAGRIVFANQSLKSLLTNPNMRSILGRKWASFYKSAENDALIKDMQDALSQASLAHGLLEYKGEDDILKYHDFTVTRTEGNDCIAIVRDVTATVAEQKRQRELATQLETARRREALSQLAAGLAHDFNNLLSAINGSAHLIGMDDKTPDAIKAHSNRIVAAGGQAARLVNRLLDLGQDTSDMGDFDLQAVISEAKVLVQSGIPKTIDVAQHNADEPVTVYGSPTDTTQVIVNLILNSVDAFAGNAGAITVSANMFEPSQDTALDVGALRCDATYGVLHIADNGPGIPDHVLPHIFEHSFSTKGAKGTGVGLAMAATTLSRLGGGIRVTTQTEGPNKGTQFSLFWPTISADPAVQAETDDQSIDLSDKMILIVDDEERVAEVLCSYLEKLGAEVSIVSDPDLAIEVIQEDPKAWDCIISDYDMGQTNGGDLVEAVRQINTEIPILIVTALSRRLTDTRISEKTVQAVFAKPVNMGQLAQTVAEKVN